MRLEVMIGNEDPLIYPIKGSRMIIGSAETCDIVLPISGVSRKHLIIVAENDRYFVMDQGSTNGSYINEERLVPGRRVEFTSFFPVRLGSDILISLISEKEEGLEEVLTRMKEVSSPRINIPDSDSTHVISLKKLRETKTENLLKLREEKRRVVKKKSPPKPPPRKPFKINYVTAAALLVIALAGYFNFFVLNDKTDDVVSTETEVPPVSVADTKPVVNAPEYEVFTDSDLYTNEELKRILANGLCVTDVEHYFCDMFPGIKEGPWGATQVGTMIHVFLDVAPYLEASLPFISYPSQKKEEWSESTTKVYELHTKEVIGLYFLLKVLPLELNEELLKDKRMTFTFFKLGSEGPEPYFSLGINPEALKKFKFEFTPEYLESARLPDAQVVVLARKYYRIY